MNNVCEKHPYAALNSKGECDACLNDKAEGFAFGWMLWLFLGWMSIGIGIHPHTNWLFFIPFILWALSWAATLIWISEE